ncbi:MAG: UMP kinase, partial [Psittacicella sp.]
MSKIKYKRILLKLSGEALQGEEGFGIDPSILSSICDEIKAAHTLGVEVAIVVGGGNFLRGADLIQYNFNKVASDQIGMLATTMNAIAIEDMLSSKGVKVKHLSPFNIKPICDTYNFREANNLLESTVLVFSGGTSNPFCTTDSAACLRGVECNVDIVLKGTKVDGIYTKDPVKFADAVKYD